MPSRKKSVKASDTRVIRDEDDVLKNIGSGVVSPVLFDPKRRKEMGLPESEDERGHYLVELNVLFRGGLGKAATAFEEMWRKLFERASSKTPAAAAPPPSPRAVSKTYFQVYLSVSEWRRMVQYDQAAGRTDGGHQVIYKLWPDFEVKPLIDRSVATVKGDAAYNAYSASGSGITWAVVDSGIDGTHPHFGDAADPENSVLYHPHVVQLHRDFSNGADENATVPSGGLHPALIDDFGHGTHVAGIIAGQLSPKSKEAATGAGVRGRGKTHAVYEQVFASNDDGSPRPGRSPVRRTVRKPEMLRGVASGCRLVSLKVMDGDGKCRVSDVMRALAYIRETLNDSPKLLRVHGVNISIGYDFDAQMFACGQSPLCVEVDRLVQSGVVVVVAAGNTGYGEVAASARVAKVGLSNTINDPGNSRLAITVGSTHRDSPHTYGVSFFSSKGPTGDGRLKPDLVAPGERITSCASAGKCRSLGINAPKGAAAYVDDSGTSLAAPHVSGAIAAFLSIRQEFIQRPDEVKRIFLESATSLGRERYFEGHGLVDLMRAIQSV